MAQDQNHEISLHDWYEMKSRLNQMEESIESHMKDVDEMRKDIKELLALANRSKGAIWGGMSMAATFGALVAWLVEHLFSK